MNKRVLIAAAALAAALIAAVLPAPVFSAQGKSVLESQVAKVLENQDRILQALDEIKKELQIVKIRASLK